VLRQGIRREHVLPVVALCTVSDIVLISVGIAGVGALITAHQARSTSPSSAGRPSSSATGYSLPAAPGGHRR